MMQPKGNKDDKEFQLTISMISRQNIIRLGE